MEPRIQYAKTKDDVSIAYWTVGEGMPVVFMPFRPSHAQLLWQYPEVRQIYERIAEGKKFISYDARGEGLSDRDVADCSVDAYVLDLEAVVDHLELDSFVLMGAVWTGMPAIVYAANHPEHVTRLVLWVCFARASDLLGSPAMQAQMTLHDSDWELYWETIAQHSFGFAGAEQAQRWAAYWQESTTQQASRAFVSQWEKCDVSDLLPRVRSPTLVLHPRQLPILPVDAARHLASQIPDARLVVMEGRTAGLTMDMLDASLPVVNEFLSEGEEATEGAAPSGLVTILFTDVEGSTALTQRLGDAKARDLLRQHERMVREALKAHGGSELKTTGDGFMASFSSATRALESAIAMQRAFAAHNESAAEPILVRVGMNAGEPIAEDEDLFGTAVIEAARIAAAAKGGEILVSNVVRELAKGKDFLFADRGEVALKGFEEPVRLYEVRWEA
jgi:class 3 adenylate cyclase/pimeloyl-ACP methyl ester carboxylesterase